MKLKLEQFIAERKGSHKTFARSRQFYKRARAMDEPIRPWREPLTGIWKDLGKKAG